MHSGTNSKRVKKKSSVSISKSKVNFYEKSRILSGADRSKGQKDDDNIREAREQWDFNTNKEEESSSITSLEEKELKIDNYKTVDAASKEPSNSKIDPREPSNSKIDPREILNFYGTMSDTTGNLIHNTEGFIYMTTPPDGGYGWIVLTAAFFSGVINDGNMLSIGTILPSIEKNLNVDPLATAFIAAVQMTMYNCIGPISGAFINKVGFRYVALIGLVFAVLGLTVGSFCKDIISLTIFFGLFFGSGVGMSVMVNTLIVAYYFEKYRTITVGAQTASTGIGLLIFGPLNTYLTKIYGWSYTLLLMSISFGCCIVICISFKKIDPKKIGRIVEALPTDDDVSVDSVEVQLTRFSVFLDEEIKNRESDEKLVEPQVASNIGKTSSVYENKENVKKFGSFAKSAPSTTDIDNEKKIVIDIDPLERVDIFSPTNPDYETTENKLGKNTQVIPGKEQEAKEVNYRLSMSRLFTPDSTKPVTKDKCCQLNKKIEHGLKVLFDTKLFKSFEFEVLNAAFFFFSIGVNVPFLYAVRRSKIPLEYSNWLLSWIGLLNVFLRFFLGFIAFYTKEKTIYLCGACVMTGGIGIWISCVIPHNLVWLEFLYCGVFAFANASFFALRAIVIINILGIEKLTNAFGLLSLSIGVSSMIGMNVAGFLVSSSYEPAFMFCGTALVISGLILLLNSKINEQKRKWQKYRSEKESSKKVHFSSSQQKL